MTNIKFSNVITTLLVVGIGGIILFCPRLGLNSQSQIKLISDGLNSILKAVGIRSMFTHNDVLNALILSEYTIFGMFLMIMLKSYTKNIVKNISIPLFIGLLLAVMSGYMSNFLGLGIISLDIVIKEFMYLLLGMLIYILLNGLFENKFGKGNCRRR